MAAASTPLRLLVPILFLAVPAAASAQSRVVLEYDDNEQLKLKKVDTNEDGVYDEFVHYEGGKTKRAERDDDHDGRVDVWIHFDDAGARAELTAERAFLCRLEGDCNVPLAALAERPSPETVVLRGLVASPNGALVVRATAEAPISDAAAAGRQAAEQVLEEGAAPILEAARAEAAG